MEAIKGFCIHFIPNGDRKPGCTLTIGLIHHIAT